MSEIVPSFLVPDERTFRSRLSLIEFHVSLVHVDVLNGTLYAQHSWFDSGALRDIQTPCEIELHLMVENPLPIVEAWKRDVPQLSRAIVHAEISRPLGSIVGEIKNTMGLHVGVALNPFSGLEDIEKVIHSIDQLTIMGVQPGSSGQAFLGEMILKKIALARAHVPELRIEIDGGVNIDNAKTLKKAGCDRLCSASYLFCADDPLERLHKLQNLVS